MTKSTKVMKNGQMELSTFVKKQMEKVAELTTSYPSNQINWKDITDIKEHISMGMVVDLSLCDKSVHKGPVYSAGFINTPLGFQKCVIGDRLENCKEFNREIKKTKKQLKDKYFDLKNMLIINYKSHQEFTYDMFLDCLSLLDEIFEEKSVPINSTTSLYKTAIRKYKNKMEELENSQTTNGKMVLRWECPEFKEMLDY